MYTENDDTIGEWGARTFPGGEGNGKKLALRILDEVIELCIAEGASPGDMSSVLVGVVYKEFGPIVTGFEEKPADPAKARSEAADVKITVAVYAKAMGGTLAADTAEKMKVNRSRRWVPIGDGTGYHIKTIEGVDYAYNPEIKALDRVKVIGYDRTFLIDELTGEKEEQLLPIYGYGIPSEHDGDNPGHGCEKSADA